VRNKFWSGGRDGGGIGLSGCGSLGYVVVRPYRIKVSRREGAG